MKTNILKIAAVVLVFAGNFASCEKPEEENYYHIVGYDTCNVEISDGTCKAGGYVLISENLKDTLAAYNVPNNLFTFPVEIMSQNISGFNLFPEEYRFAYKVQMTYRQMTEEEKLQTSCTYPAIYPRVCFFEPVYIMVESISKTQ